MRFPIVIVMIISFLMGLLGCGKKRELHRGQYQDQTFVFQSVEHQGLFSVNSFDYTVKLGRLPKVEITASTTDWGPPYTEDLYKGTPWAYVTETRPAYADPLATDKPVYTMLYLPPSRFDRDEFDQYVAFFKSEWPALDRQFADGDLRGLVHIIGLVHGNSPQFTQRFLGKVDNQELAITVLPDGRVRYGAANGSSEQSCGLAYSVQMPGLRIPLEAYPGSLSLAQIQQFKDAKGKTLTDYFNVPAVQ
jgi:hypothetical protein